MFKVALTVLALAALTPQKTTFEWKPVKGSSVEYKTTNLHKADFGAGEEELVISWTSKVTVDKVEGKKVWLKIENGAPRATIGGQEAVGVQVEIPDETEEHGLDGRYYVPEGSSGFGFGLYGGFLIPSSPLAPGEGYEADGLKAKYVGLEKVGSWDGYKFSFSYKPKEGAWSEGEVWFSVKDMSLLRRKIVMHNVDFGHGPMDITNDLVRTK